MKISGFADRIKRRAKRLVGIDPNHFGDFDNFDSALAACTRGSSWLSNNKGADLYAEIFDQHISELKAGKLEPSYFQNRLLPVFVGLACVNSQFTKNVLDWGGGDGFMCDAIRHYLAPAFEARWDVVETDVMVANSSRFSPNEKKRFFTSFENVRHEKYGLALAIGMFHLVPEPYKALEDLFSMNFEYLVLGWVPGMPERAKDRLMVFDNGGQSFPCWFFGKSFEDRLGKFGEVIFEIDNLRKASSLSGDPITNKSYIIRRRGQGLNE